LDFQTFSGFTVTAVGVKTDSMAITGQTGRNPPSIAGTNTGYHSMLFLLNQPFPTCAIILSNNRWGGGRNVVFSTRYDELL